MCSGPAWELFKWEIGIGIVVLVGNSLGGGELSQVGSCPRTGL